MPENNGNNANNHRRPRTATRNWVAKHQWQRGGVHDKTNKAKRQKAKQQLKRNIRSQSAADFFVVLPSSIRSLRRLCKT